MPEIVNDQLGGDVVINKEYAGHIRKSMILGYFILSPRNPR